VRRSTWCCVQSDVYGAIALALVAGCLSGCSSNGAADADSICSGKDATTTWTAEARSPDGEYVASARSIQTGGPGTAYAGTSVCLNQLKQPQVEILGFSQELATISLRMKWLDARHLDVAYGPSRTPGDSVTVDFQVVKFGPVQISLHRLPRDSLR
jgi:hypothetical protein